MGGLENNMNIVQNNNSANFSQAHPRMATQPGSTSARRDTAKRSR
jgi:hypothetical protein